MNHIFLDPTLKQHPQSHETTASMLERMSAATVHALNAKDFDFTGPEAQEVLSHISRDYKARMDGMTEGGQEISWSEQIASWKQRAEINPDVQFKIYDLSSSVDERLGLARVFMSMEVTGISDVTLHAMNEVKWRRIFGEWQCYYLIGMRGSPSNAGG